MDQKLLEKKYLQSRVFGSLWFMGAIGLFFYRFFMTDYSVGILDAISFGIGLLAEIPTGALADHFGRKKLVIIGIVIAGLGMSAQGLARGYWLILVGQVAVTVGWAFRSGADDALFYDSLKYDESSSSWKKLVSKGNQIGLATTLIANVIGGFLYTLSPRLPFLAAILTIGGALVIIDIPEIRNKRSAQKKKLKAHLDTVRIGLTQLLNKQIIGYIPIILVLEGLFYSFGYGLLRPILQSRFNFGASASGIVLLICGLVALIFQKIQNDNVDKISERNSIFGIGIIATAALILGSFSIGHLGFVVILIIYVSEYLLDPIISAGLNTHMKSDNRATGLSAASFLKSLPYVITAPVIGYLNSRGELNIYLLTIAVLNIFAVTFYLLNIRDQKQLSNFSNIFDEERQQ